ncbi:PREDICTED: uncharacterized protein LOC108965108 [Bactrocera latifrons]|uniref:Uncharacterized protein n=1 Tax=Bactrocera latifrons TaxID=174628 RepID=A0A0K8UC94_BACLA|nr:PREDICTED: uncharacterized protein LOC108965108 [Bactrocera latifrons]
MSIPFCQCTYKLRNECEHAYGSANGYNRKRHEDPDYVDEHALHFIRTFSAETHKNYLLARHLKDTSNGQWKTLQWLMQGDLDAVLDKRITKRTFGRGAETARTAKTTKSATTYASQEKVDKSLYVPLTKYFDPESIEQLVPPKHKSKHVLDYTVRIKSKQDLDVHASKIEEKEFKIFPDNMKRGLGTIGIPRIDKDLERTGQKFYPTAGYVKTYRRSIEKNKMKSFIKTMNQFYADVAEPPPIDTDSVEELRQTLQEEFYRAFSYKLPSYRTEEEETKLRLSAVIRILKTMPGYGAFERVLFHEPFDRDKPWTWLRTFPKRIPKEYLKRVSENIINDMKKWKRQQKIIAMTYSPLRRAAIGGIKNPRLRNKRGRKNLRSQTTKEDEGDDDY